MKNQNRPYVILQMSATLDGRIAFGPDMTMFDSHPAAKLLPDGGPIWTKVGEAIEAERHPAATMMGSGTVERAGVPPRELPPFEGDTQALYADFLPEEVLAQTAHWWVLVDGRGRCRGGYKATENPGGHILHLVSLSAPPEHLAFLRRERIPYLIGGREHADLAGALEKLHARLGVGALRLWGGGTLNGAMLRAGLIDEIHLIVQPVLQGGSRAPTLADCADLAPDERPALLQLISAKPEEGGFLWLHYRMTNRPGGAPASNEGETE